MNSIEKLTQIFTHFPGIGPRQARRFVYYLLTRSGSTLTELAEHIKDLKKEIAKCENCQRFFPSNKLHHTSKYNGDHCLCNICADPNRDHATLMIVQRDIDLEAVEKNGVFNGIYFVLGGSVPILEKEPEKKIRIKELKEFTNKNINNLKEIILGVNWNPEGENTGDYVKREIESLLKNTQSASAKLRRDEVKISHLGKGLSMGAELEYTDGDTLKNALKNRA